MSRGLGLGEQGRGGCGETPGLASSGHRGDRADQSALTTTYGGGDRRGPLGGACLGPVPKGAKGPRRVRGGERGGNRFTNLTG